MRLPQLRSGRWSLCPPPNCHHLRTSTSTGLQSPPLQRCHVLWRGVRSTACLFRFEATAVTSTAHVPRDSCVKIAAYDNPGAYIVAGVDDGDALAAAGQSGSSVAQVPVCLTVCGVVIVL